MRVVLRRAAGIAAPGARLRGARRLEPRGRRRLAHARRRLDRRPNFRAGRVRRKSRRPLAFASTSSSSVVPPHRRRRSESANTRPPRAQASRFAFAVVRSEAARRVAFDHGWFRRWSSPTAPEAVDVLCEVGQVVLRVAAGEALISEEAMKAPYLRACVVSAAWRGGCVEVELEVSGRHEFRVARVVAETADATQIHDADGEQRATRAAHAVKLRIACAAPKARPASPVNVVDEALDAVPESRVPAVRVLVLVE